MTLTALLDQLEGSAARSPVLIVFEDVHWIDPTSLDLLDRTIARVADLPVLLVTTFRPELEPTWVGQPHVKMLPLSRLGRRDSASIIGGVTKGEALPDIVVEQVLAHTDGVPLFLEELTSTLLESGLLRETTDRYVLDGPLPPLAVPTTATTARGWRSPTSSACARSSPAATSASASFSSAQAGARMRRSTSPPRRPCAARWACGSGWSRWRRRCVSCSSRRGPCRASPNGGHPGDRAA
jgi:hypothetical protein